VLLVQKLPPGVKKGFDGSKRLQMTFPHMHSNTGFPSLSLIDSLFRSQAQSWFSFRTNSYENPLTSK